MRLRAKLRYAGVLSVVLACRAALGGTIFKDDFSGDVPFTGAAYADASVAPNVPSTFHPAITAPDVGAQWMVRTFTAAASNNPIVSRQYAVQVRSDDPVNPGNNYLTLMRNRLTAGSTNESFGYAHAQLTNADAAANTGRTVTASLKLYIKSTDFGLTTVGAGTTSELFRIVGSPSNTTGNYNNDGNTSAGLFATAFITGSVRFYTNGTIGVQGGGLVNPGDLTPLPTFKFDEWNTVTFKTDFSAAVPYFTVGLGNSLGNNVSAQQKLSSPQTTLGTLQFASFQDSVNRIDDVVIANDAVSNLAGDFDRDGDLDADDIGLLFAAAPGSVPPANPIFDVTGDGVVNPTPNSAGSDADLWVRSLKRTEYGDANLDGRVNFDDLLVLASNYNGPSASWAQGNFNGVPGVNFDDLLLLAANYNFTAPAGLRGALTLPTGSSVPEPSILLIALAPISVLSRGRRSSNSSN